MRKFLISIAALLIAGAAWAQTEREETEVVTNSSGYKLLRTRGHNWLWGFGATTPPSTFNSRTSPVARRGSTPALGRLVSMARRDGRAHRPR